MGELLTIAEAAKRAGLAESTARFYRDRHAAFFPIVGEGRGRRYPVEVVDVLRAIAEAAGQGATPAMIDATLKARFPIEGRLQQQQPAAAQQQDAAAVLALLDERIRQAVRDEVERIVRDEVSGVMAELTTLREDVARLTAALSAGQQQEQQQQPQPPAAPIEASEPPNVDQSQPAPVRPWWKFWERPSP